MYSRLSDLTVYERRFSQTNSHVYSEPGTVLYDLRLPRCIRTCWQQIEIRLKVERGKRNYENQDKLSDIQLRVTTTALGNL
jgi:hypothetical protein